MNNYQTVYHIKYILQKSCIRKRLLMASELKVLNEGENIPSF